MVTAQKMPTISVLSLSLSVPASMVAFPSFALAVDPEDDDDYAEDDDDDVDDDDDDYDDEDEDDDEEEDHDEL